MNLDAELLVSKFTRMGARLDLFSRGETTRLDVRESRRGEYFELNTGSVPYRDFLVMDLDPGRRHLLLMQRAPGERPTRYLCGHDERHWFVAAVPEAGGASNVREAMEQLKPKPVREALRSKKIKGERRQRRRNEAYVRQGEWFFVPLAEDQSPGATCVHYAEPLSRGPGSKPHLVDEVIREGGTTVYVTQRYPAGLTERQRADLFRRKPAARDWNWTVFKRDPRVLARGRVRHLDHATIFLDGWHEVHMNTERQARGNRHIVFLD